jgi:hypothetical protein
MWLFLISRSLHLWERNLFWKRLVRVSTVSASI